MITRMISDPTKHMDETEMSRICELPWQGHIQSSLMQSVKTQMLKVGED